MPLFESNIQSLAAGTTLATGPKVSFANSNGISFGVSGNTITATVGTMTAGGGVDIQAGTVVVSSGTVVFSNSNNVTFGLTGSTMTASATVASTQGSINVSAGTAANNLSNVVFSNSNNITFGLNASTITASVTVASSQGSINFSAGAASANLTNVVFSNSSGISFGLNGSTITARLPSMSYFVPAHDAISAISVAPASTGGVNMSLQRVTTPYAFNVSRIDLLGSLTVNGSTAGSFTLSIGLYTIGGVTLSLLSSSSTAYTFNSGTTNTTNQYGGFSGIRWRSIPTGGWSLPPSSDFMLAIMGSVDGPAGTTGGLSLFGVSSVNPAGGFGAGNYTDYFADGAFSAGTGVFPATMSITDILQTGSLAVKGPYFRMIGSGP